MYPLSWSRRHKEYRSPVHMLQHSEHTSQYQTNLKKPPYYLVCRCGEDSEVRRSLLGQPGRSSCTLPSSSCVRCSWHQLQSRWRRANKREREKKPFSQDFCFTFNLRSDVQNENYYFTFSVFTISPTENSARMWLTEQHQFYSWSTDHMTTEILFDALHLIFYRLYQRISQ